MTAPRIRRSSLGRGLETIVARIWNNRQSRYSRMKWEHHDPPLGDPGLALNFETGANSPEVFCGGLQRALDLVARLRKSSPQIYKLPRVLHRVLFIRSPNLQIIRHITNPF